MSIENVEKHGGLRTLSLMRSILLGVILVALVGTGMELVLLGHVETITQIIPVGLIGSALAVLAWYGLGRSAAGLRAFQVLMAFFLVAGVAGMLLHYWSNMEFELEMYPTIGGTELFGKAMTGAIPALAPGSMIQIGLLGLTYTFRHPALSSTEVTE